mmetsp:Transcript_4288/g.15427  ORF Transcript_4288/g.15427 Transcript_4288/m.15427 type:complete len:246 (-) Transcript_4288:695-1432(-)
MLQVKGRLPVRHAAILPSSWRRALRWTEVTPYGPSAKGFSSANSGCSGLLLTQGSRVLRSGRDSDSMALCSKAQPRLTLPAPKVTPTVFHCAFSSLDATTRSLLVTILQPLSHATDRSAYTEGTTAQGTWGARSYLRTAASSIRMVSSSSAEILGSSSNWSTSSAHMAQSVTNKGFGCEANCPRYAIMNRVSELVIGFSASTRSLIPSPRGEHRRSIPNSTESGPRPTAWSASTWRSSEEANRFP